MKTTNQFINLSLKGFLEIADAYTLPIVSGSFGNVMISDGVGGVTWQPASALSLTTDNITEATNKYFTDERVDDRISALIQNGTGLTWTYNDPSNTFTGNVSLTPFSTTNLVEGTNKYFTDERVDDRVAMLVKNGTGISWVYNDGLNTLTPTISLSPFTTDNLTEGTTNKYFTNESIDDRVATLIQNGTGITWTYNDPSNTFTGNVSLTPFSTTNLVEGTRLYFTNERVDDRVAALIQNSATISWVYNDGLNTLTANAAASPIEVEKNGSLVSTRGTINFIEGTGVTLSIADNGGADSADVTINASGTGTLNSIFSNTIQVGDSDIENLNFSNKFNVTESPDKYVSVDISMMIGELSDVSIVSPIANGDALLYNSTLGIWENSAFPDKLINLSDVSITSPTAGDLILYTGGGNWANFTLSSVVSLQAAYDNSVNGTIVTSTSIGAFTIKRGSTADTDIIFEGQNGAGSQTFSINGNGLITTGTWNGTTIAIANGGTGQTTAQTAINALTQVSGATNEYVLTKDTATGDAIWKVSGGSAPALSAVLTVGNKGLAGQDIELINGGSFIIDPFDGGPPHSSLIIYHTAVSGGAGEGIFQVTGTGPSARSARIKAGASVILDGTVSVNILNNNLTISNSGFTAALAAPTLTGPVTWTHQDRSGTISHIDQIGGQDVNTLITTPTAGQDGYVIAWNESANEYELVVGGGGATILNDLTDVDTFTTPPVDGNVLTFGGSPGEWTPQAPKRTWTWTASSINNTTNSYLKGAGGTFTNNSPYIAAFNCKLTAVSASTNGTETWNAEVHVNGSNVGSLVITASDNGYASPLSISITAGDKISFYCNGTSINGPSITGWFSEV